MGTRRGLLGFTKLCAGDAPNAGLQMRLPIRLQRIDQNVFDRPLSDMAAVLSTTPLGLAKHYPIGGTITGASVVAAINKGFHQHWRDAIARLPVTCQPFERQTQHV